MPIDPSRATFVQNEFRIESATDFSVKAKYSNAQIVEISTQLDQASAATLASTMLAETKIPALTFTLTITGTIALEEFAGTVNRYVVTFAKFGVVNRTMKLIGAKTDWLNNRTTITVRG